MTALVVDEDVAYAKLEAIKDLRYRNKLNYPRDFINLFSGQSWGVSKEFGRLWFAKWSGLKAKKEPSLNSVRYGHFKFFFVVWRVNSFLRSLSVGVDLYLMVRPQRKNP